VGWSAGWGCPACRAGAPAAALAGEPVGRLVEQRGLGAELLDAEPGSGELVLRGDDVAFGVCQPGGWVDEAARLVAGEPVLVLSAGVGQVPLGAVVRCLGGVTARLGEGESVQAALLDPPRGVQVGERLVQRSGLGVVGGLGGGECGGMAGAEVGAVAGEDGDPLLPRLRQIRGYHLVRPGGDAPSRAVGLLAG
jgi:hypothetical protein